MARTVILVLFLRFFYWVVATANGGAFSKKDSETQTDRQTDRQIERKKETERERERESEFSASFVFVCWSPMLSDFF